MAKAKRKVHFLTLIGEAQAEGADRGRRIVSFTANANMKAREFVCDIEDAIRLRNELTRAIASVTPRIREPGVL